MFHNICLINYAAILIVIFCDIISPFGLSFVHAGTSSSALDAVATSFQLATITLSLSVFVWKTREGSVPVFSWSVIELCALANLFTYTDLTSLFISSDEYALSIAFAILDAT